LLVIFVLFVIYAFVVHRSRSYLANVRPAIVAQLEAMHYNDICICATVAAAAAAAEADVSQGSIGGRAHTSSKDTDRLLVGIADSGTFNRSDY